MGHCKQSRSGQHHPSHKDDDRVPQIDEPAEASKLIGEIYDAALDQARWPVALERTCAYLNGKSVALFVEDTAGKVPILFHSWGMDTECLQLHAETYAKLNPMNVPAMTASKVGDIMAAKDLVPFTESERRIHYKEQLAPPGIVDAIYVMLEKSSTSFAMLAVHRDARGSFIDDNSIYRLHLLAPHFRRAVSIGKMIDFHHAQIATLADTLDGVMIAVFLVDADARIIHTNASANSMLEDRGVISSSGGALVVSDPTGHLALRAAIAAAPLGDGAIGTKSITIPLVSNKDRLLAHILRLPSGMQRKAGLTSSSVAAVFIRKVEIDLRHPVETLAALFDLTPAERRILHAIVDASGVAEVARTLGVSQATVKTHLQRIFGKTRTTRQAELVKLVAGFMSPLGSGWKVMDQRFGG